MLKLYFFNGLYPPSFCLFSFFSHDKYSTNTINDKSVEGVLGAQTQGGRMVGADESTELWRHPFAKICLWHHRRLTIIGTHGNCSLSLSTFTIVLETSESDPKTQSVVFSWDYKTNTVPAVDRRRHKWQINW